MSKSRCGGGKNGHGYAVFVLLGFVHLQVGAVDGVGQRVRAVHTADAYGGVPARAAGHRRALHPAADLLQAGSKDIGRDVLEEQHKLIAAIPHQNIRGADTLGNAAYN